MGTIPCSGTHATVSVIGSRGGKTAAAAAETAVAAEAATVPATRGGMPTPVLRKQRQRKGQRKERREGTEATHMAIL